MSCLALLLSLSLSAQSNIAAKCAPAECPDIITDLYNTHNHTLTNTSTCIMSQTVPICDEHVQSTYMYVRFCVTD